ncbi:MAG: zf-HC2 domain-containing protein [Gemmatimonadaceae bacterium]|nr:zf-HC2 domain-containing protein [Gemmatimonadaceae bacterium]
MTSELWMTHPGFDALSAHVDDDRDGAAGSRVGRHLAHCERCRGIVEEIRGLGSALRATEGAIAPAGLWSRIDASANRAATVAAMPTLLVGDPLAREPRASASRIAPHRNRSRRMVIGAGLVAAAAVAAVVAWPHRASLEAAGTSRLTFSPARPVPGGQLSVRYQPAEWMSPTPTLILVGRQATGAGAYPSAFGGEVFAGLGDSLGTLTRAPDGTYVATLTLPRTFLALGLTVLDLEQDEFDADGVRPWIIIGGTASREPSYASFVAARDIDPAWFGGPSHFRPRQSVDVADSLKRYFPSHPAGWAYARASRSTIGGFDMFRFFQSGERKYASMHERLWGARNLDAERLHHMALFANAIEEPGEALRWVARLVEEHPEDPRALADLAGALHDMELREPPALRDSIRSWLASLDRAYRAAPVPNRGFEDALRLAMTYGDSSTRTLWSGRQADNGTDGNIYMMARMVRTGPTRTTANDDRTKALRERAARRCELPAGRRPIAETLGGWRTRCERYRGMAFGVLSSAALRDGDARLGHADADSALAAMRRGAFCAPSLAYINRARARLILGDTAGAATDFTFSAAAYPSGMTTVADTARAALGPRFDRERFVAGADVARRAAAACIVAQRVREKARENRTGGLTMR